MRPFVLLAAIALGSCATLDDRLSPASPVSQSATLNVPEQQAVVHQLADALSRMYVEPATGERYATALRSDGLLSHYAGRLYETTFAERVKADLQAVAPDAHLRLLPNSVLQEGHDEGRPSKTGLPDGIEAMRMIGRTAYLQFSAFPHDPRTAPAARTFLIDHAADANAVIIDGRDLPGGGLEVMDAILPLFFAEPTLLARMETRAEGDAESLFQDGPTLQRRKGRSGFVTRDHVLLPDAAETGLRTVPLYYLISGKTASAGEHLAMILQRTGRAKLVGETTRGANHFVALIPVGDRLTAVIPVGRTFDPDTGRDWEGTGVTPDIAVPADAALDRTLAVIAEAGQP